VDDDVDDYENLSLDDVWMVMMRILVWMMCG
jgi:hypothetical protein